VSLDSSHFADFNALSTDFCWQYKGPKITKRLFRRCMCFEFFAEAIYISMGMIPNCVLPVVVGLFLGAIQRYGTGVAQLRAWGLGTTMFYLQVQVGGYPPQSVEME